MKSVLKYLFLCIQLGITSCDWFEEDVVRKVSCIQPDEYEYLEHDWIDSICTTEICSIYTEVWKELFIKRNNMTEGYFRKHITIINSASFGNGSERFEIGYRVQNGWAIAEWWDGFVIKIDEDDNGYPDIGLPKGTYLTFEQIEATISNGGFLSRIGKAPKTGPLRYSSMNEALDSLIKEAKVDTMCFRKVFLSLSIGTLTLEAFAVYEDEENSCIEGTIDLITGRTYIHDVSCE